MILNIFSVFIGGGIGVILRYLASILSNKFFSTSLIGTFCVNILGCFLIGCVLGFTINKIDALPHILKLFITVGILGGLTTFSTLNLEVFELIKSGRIFLGISYLFLSCFIGLSFTYFGYLLSNIKS